MRRRARPREYSKAERLGTWRHLFLANGAIEFKNRAGAETVATRARTKAIAAGNPDGKLFSDTIKQQAPRGEVFMRPLEFGWYLPTHGDTTAYGLMEAQIADTPDLCERVVAAAEAAALEYLLIPV